MIGIKDIDGKGRGSMNTIYVVTEAYKGIVGLSERFQAVHKAKHINSSEVV